MAAETPEHYKEVENRFASLFSDDEEGSTTFIETNLKMHTYH